MAANKASRKAAANEGLKNDFQGHNVGSFVLNGGFSFWDKLFGSKNEEVDGKFQVTPANEIAPLGYVGSPHTNMARPRNVAALVIQTVNQSAADVQGARSTHVLNAMTLNAPVIVLDSSGGRHAFTPSMSMRERP
jgi:hypothetical protein